MQIRRDDECYVGSGPASELLPKVVKPCPDWAGLGPLLLEALEAEEEWRGREAAGEIDPEWDYEFLVANKRRALIAKAKEGGA
jgi:hypothetical protein